MIQNKNNGIEKPPWNATRSIFISVDTYHRRKPDPMKFDCAGDLKRQLGRVKQRVVLALIDLLCLFVSASVELSPSPKLASGASAGLKNQQS